MNLTEAARDAIIDVMKKKDLDTKEWFLEFRIIDNGAIGLGFTRTPMRKVLEFGELHLTVDGVIDTEGVVVDYGNNDGRKGLFFMSSDDKLPDRHKNIPESASGACGKPDCSCDGDCDDTQCGGSGCTCSTNAGSS